MATHDLSVRLNGLQREFEEVEARLADPAVIADQTRYVELSRRYSELQPIVERTAQLIEAEGDLEAAKELISLGSGEERDALRADAAESESAVDRLVEELKLLLLPKDPNDDRNVIVEIRGAEGGEEANLFARNLFELYRAYSSRRCLLALLAKPREIGPSTSPESSHALQRWTTRLHPNPFQGPQPGRFDPAPQAGPTLPEQPQLRPRSLAAE